MAINSSASGTAPAGERMDDFSSRLLKDRIVFLGTAVTDEVAASVINQFLFLERHDPEKDIHLYINSPGGSVSAGLAIYDVMGFVRCDVATYGLGLAASMGSLLLTAGDPGKRHIMPNGRVLLHQPHLGEGRLGGPISEIEIQARELVRMKEALIGIYARHTGRKAADLTRLMERDHYLNAEEACAFGVVDGILESRRRPATGRTAG